MIAYNNYIILNMMTMSCRFEAAPTTTSFLLSMCRIFEKQEEFLMSCVLKSSWSGLGVKAYLQVKKA